VVSFKLVRRNLAKHWGRSGLTVASLVVAIFLVCVLRALVYSLDAGIRGAKRDRLVVQSAVSLFENLPISYQQKLAAVPGVVNTCKFHWFGAYYQDPSNWFAQFAVDPQALVDMYPEIQIVGGKVSSTEGDAPGFLEDKQGCIVGKVLADEMHKKYGGWQVGDTFPLISFLYPAEPGQEWKFRVRAIYEPKSSALDSRTVFFHWDYFEDTLRAQKNSAPPAVATYALLTAKGADQAAVAHGVEAQFVGGQQVQCCSEAEFNAQFVTMLGSVPFFLAAIGGGVLVAILFACVNTMLMAFREQTHDVGVMKALGFTDGAVGATLLAQSLVLCGTGGLLGVALAKLAEPVVVLAMGKFFPGYEVTPAILGLGAAITLGVGLVAGIVPCLSARRLACVAALRSVE
jgi:putative ABC transport system permease protein